MNITTAFELKKIIENLPVMNDHVGDGMGLCSPTNEETPEELRNAIANKESLSQFLTDQKINKK